MACTEIVSGWNFKRVKEKHGTRLVVEKFYEYRYRIRGVNKSRLSMT